MKKYLIIVFLIITSIIISSSQAQLLPATGAYLGTIKNSDWSIMAQVATGVTPADTVFLKTIDGASANDYATYILAITALGKDPRSFGSENLVEKLKLKVNNGQIGDASLLNDDIFGLLALKAAGASANDDLVVNEIAYIKSKQLTDGSWDFTTTSTVGSADMTAMGIMALRAAGIQASDPALVKAAGYLLTSENNDGGWPMLPGSASNTESTAWVLSAIYSLGDQVSFWSKGGHTPLDYLTARIQAGGYAAFDSIDTSITARTPVTTAYAAIALAGKYYPIQTISAPLVVNLRIEGKNSTICETQVEARTALDVVSGAASTCGYTYHIQDTQYGPYLDTINSEAAAGYVGWSFLINNMALQVGAGDYLVKTDDNILLYYGNWDDLPLRLTSSADAVNLNDTTAITIEKYDYNRQAWLAASNVTIKRNSETFTTDSTGKASINWPQAGNWQLVAEGTNLIRSAKISIKAGAGSGLDQNLGLSVNVVAPAITDGNNQTLPLASNAVVFGVNGDLNFGSLAPGQSATKIATISNNGTSNIITTASVSGSTLFTKYMNLDNQAVAGWKKNLDKGTQGSVNVKLSIPNNYTRTGKEQGSLVFWANVLE